jgi:hypothetical protein
LRVGAIGVAEARQVDRVAGTLQDLRQMLPTQAAVHQAVQQHQRRAIPGPALHTQTPPVRQRNRPGARHTVDPHRLTRGATRREALACALRDWESHRYITAHCREKALAGRHPRAALPSRSSVGAPIRPSRSRSVAWSAPARASRPIPPLLSRDDFSDPDVSGRVYISRKRAPGCGLLRALARQRAGRELR